MGTVYEQKNTIAATPGDDATAITDNADHSRLASSVFGNYPATWYLEWTGIASAVVATPVYTSPDVSMYNFHTFEAVTNTAKIEVQVSSAGTWLAKSVFVDGVIAATIAAGKIGELNGKYYAVRMKPNAAASTNGFGAHGVV